MNGMVPTRCEAGFTASATITDARTLDLGTMTRRCNDGKGYRIILHTPSGLKGAVLILGGRQVPLSDSGVTVVVDSNIDERANEPARIILSDTNSPLHFDPRLETIPKGEIF